MNYKSWAILSGFFFALNLVLDGFNLKIIFENIYVYAFLGGWIAVILTFLVAFFFGKKFDKNFKKVGAIPKKGIKYALLAGLFAAAYTFFLLYLIKKSTPQQLVHLYPLHSSS